MRMDANSLGRFVKLNADTKDERELLRAIAATIKFGGYIQCVPDAKDTEGVRLEFDGHFSNDTASP